MFAVQRATESNRDEVGLRISCAPSGRKLATRGKIAQCVGTLSKDVSGCLLMDLCGC
jgi:hypothetical protein